MLTCSCVAEVDWSTGTASDLPERWVLAEWLREAAAGEAAWWHLQPEAWRAALLQQGLVLQRRGDA
eukprot:8455616-Lingulodinium_polyedra.AAC.1